MKSPYPSQSRIAFRPTSRLALLVGFTALVIASPSVEPLPGQPPGDAPSTPEAPLPSRPAEDFNSQAPGAPRKPSRASVRVLVEMAGLSTASTRLSQLATRRASHAEVRVFASQVTQASQALVEEIDRLAAAKNVSIQPAPPRPEADNRSGAAFDEEYLRRTRRLHEDAIAALEEYKGGEETDPHITAMAEQYLPGLQRQLHQAEELDNQVSRNPSRRPDDVIAGEPPSAISLRHPPAVLALHEEGVE